VTPLNATGALARPFAESSSPRHTSPSGQSLWKKPGRRPEGRGRPAHRPRPGVFRVRFEHHSPVAPRRTEMAALRAVVEAAGSLTLHPQRTPGKRLSQSQLQPRLMRAWAPTVGPWRGNSTHNARPAEQSGRSTPDASSSRSEPAFWRAQRWLPAVPRLHRIQPNLPRRQRRCSGHAPTSSLLSST
jgi:hypothetical protein